MLDARIKQFKPATVIKWITEGKIKDFRNIPKDFLDLPEFIHAERKMNLRRTIKGGYDVINDQFFVEEAFVQIVVAQEEETTRTTQFGTFTEFYNFMEGNIYDRMFYYGYKFSIKETIKYRIKKALVKYEAPVNETLNDCLPHELEKIETNYNTVEKNKTNIRRWLKRYYSCNTYEELLKVDEAHKRSTDKTSTNFYIWNYINQHGDRAFEPLLQLMNHGYYTHIFMHALIFVYGEEKVTEAYKSSTGEKKRDAKKHSNFRNYLKEIHEKGLEKREEKYFDKDTHYFCVKDCYYLKNDPRLYPVASTFMYFENFEQFTNYLHHDLSDCNLLWAKGITIDDTCLTNENTVFPFEDITHYKKTITKKYDRHFGRFMVNIQWKDVFDKVIFTESRRFDYFAEFLSFLDYDLSGADLLFCDGLLNLQDASGISFNNARLTSRQMEHLGIQFETIKYNSLPVSTDAEVLSNEEKTAITLSDNHSDLSTVSNNESTNEKIFYISDLHLLHKITRKTIKTRLDTEYYFQKTVDGLLRNQPDLRNSVLLIGGDVSSEPSLFKQFVIALRNEIDGRHLSLTVIFVLGNHDLWAFKGKTIDFIVRQYRNLLDGYGMYLLHNEILFLNDARDVEYIKEDEILRSTSEEIRNKALQARLILFGGIGYSGKNKVFNADNGIYRGVINRLEEVYLSESFENLYDHVESCLSDKQIIVFTHMRMSDWKENHELHDNFVYVSGHNHRNEYYDDGVRRLYADNQAGYYNDNPRLKCFTIDGSYDLFSEYADGIYEISRAEYIGFYRGKNIAITFNRDFEKLYMLKKNGYYCFLLLSKTGSLSMLNGGAIRTLANHNVEYYYRNMDYVVQIIKTPLSKYQDFQKQIADEIKRIGGSGRIHGAIIDIDGNDGHGGWQSIAYNHIYVNPYDMTITPYFAYDMVEKYVYPDVPALLFSKCPALFENYKGLLQTKKKPQEGAVILQPYNEYQLSVKPVYYPDTDIYKESRELRKMQKLNVNILTTWTEYKESEHTRPLQISE